MPNLTTFGFEFEVQTEAPALVRELYELGHIAMEQMHRWHCDCFQCTAIDTEPEFSQFMYKAQTDSSCSGEVISRILHHDPTNPRYRGDVFYVLQQAALDVDAEPGPQAGMHVHVGIDHMSEQDKADAIWAFVKYEPVLLRIAAGRWHNHRGGNSTLRETCQWALRDWGFDAAGSGAWSDAQEHNEYPRLRRQLLAFHQRNDRHSNLNVNTGHGTFEYRLWNSTRSAWRMELFTRLSVALVDPVVTAVLNAEEFPTRVSKARAVRLAEILDQCEHAEAASLLARHIEYSWTAAANAPSTLTA